MIHVFTFNNYHFHTMKNLLSKTLSLFILFFVCAQSAQAQGSEVSAPAEITASSTATLTTFDITSNTTWRLTLSPTVDWVTNFVILGSTGDDSNIDGFGNQTIVITHEANTDAESRKATFTLSATDVLGGSVVGTPKEITFTQQAPINPLFSPLYTQSISASSDATETTYNTEATGNWRFSLSSESSWITNISVAGSPGHPYAINGRYGTDIRITHTANTTSEVREATFTYVDENDFLGNYYTITLRQEAGATAPVTTGVITTQAEVAALSIERFTFDGDLIIESVQGEDRIIDLSPLSNITEVTGDVIIDGGAAADGLTSLKGLRQLQTIGGSFTISNHSALTALGIFPSLQSIGGSFRVFGNSVLTNLGGFSNLANIGSTEEVLIVNTLTGITNIGSADEELPSNSIGFKENISLFIMSNPLLEDCCVLTSFFAGATHAVSGEIRIGNNAIGCSDEGRIKISCSLITLTDLDSILSEENFSESKFHYLPQIPEEFRAVNTVYTANVNPTDQTFTVGIDIDNSATGWIVNTTNVFSSSSNSLKEVEDFITFSNTTGMGDGTLDIRVAENTDIAARTAVITFTPTGGGNPNVRFLVITQEAAFPTLTISGSYPISPKIGSEARYTMNVPPEPGTLTINIALGGGAIGWGVSAQNNSGAITLSADPLDRIGRGDGTVDIIIANNTSTSAVKRSAIFSFFPITTTGENRNLPVVLEITQLASSAEIPTIDLSGTEITAPSKSEMNYTTNVNYTAQTLSVNIDIGGSTTGWTISKTSDTESFVTLPTTTSGAADDRVDITIAANTFTERSATIIFTSTGGEGNPEIRTLVITQKAGPAILILSSIREYVLTQGVLSPVSNIDTDDNINYTASVGPMLQTLDVTVDIGGNVTGWEVSKSEDADFISLVMRDDRVGITIAPNATIEKRSATLTITSTGDTKTTFTRYLEITQTAGYPTLTLSSTPTPFSVVPDDVVDYTLNVDSSSQEILVNIDLGGSTEGWSVYKKGDFISFSNSDTTGTEDETVTFLIESNTSNTARSALITFLATGPTAAENDTVIVDGETVIFARTITLAQTVRITQLAGNVQPPTLTLSGEGIILPTEDNPNHTVNVSATEKTLDVKIDLDGSATGWKVSRTLDIENFITLPATTVGMGDSTVGIAIAENSTTEKRSATITFTSTSTEENSGSPIVQTLVITQEGMTTLTLTSPNTVNVESTATTPNDFIEITFIVENGATGWTATLSGNPFLKLNKRSGNAGLDTIKAAAIANTGAERTATITLTTIGDTGPVDSKTITIKQAVGPHKLTLSTFSNVDFRRGEESDTVIADAMTTTFATNINIGDGAAMGWEATKTSDLADFITLPADSVVVGNGDGRLDITIEASTVNADRTATITFTTTGDEGDPITRTLVITQKRPLLLVSSDTLTVGFRDTTITVSIDIDGRSVTGWEAKEISDLTNFVTLPENSEGVADGTLDIMVKANTLDFVRETRVILIPKIVGGGIDTVTFIDNVRFAGVDGIFRPRRIELVLYLPTRKMGMDTTIELNTQSDSYLILYDRIEAFLKRRSYTRVENIISPTLVIRQEANPNHTLDISSPDVDLRMGEESDTVILGTANDTTFTVSVDIGGGATGWKVKQISDRGQVMTFPVFSVGDSVLGDGTLEIMIKASNINRYHTFTIIFATTGETGNPMERTLVIRQDASPPTLNISSSDVTIRKGEESDTAIVDATEQSLTVNIALGESTADWAAIGTSNFISLDSDKVSGRGDGTLDITIEANTLSTERNDTITFTTTAHSGIIDNEYRFSDTVILIITQLAVDFPTLTILGDTLSAGGIDRPVVFEGGAQTFTVAIDIAGSSLENWEISEVDEGDFVTLPNSTTGTGNSEVEFTLSNNESTAFRTATITFTFTGGPSGSSVTQTLEIFQYQKLLTLSGVGIEPLSGDGKYQKRTLSHIAQDFDVSITLDDIISDWKITFDDKNRFVILPESTTGTGDGEVTFRILNNSNTTENRADTITFEGTGEGIEIVTRRFLVIEQDALPIIGIVDPGNRDVTYEAGSVDIEITTNVPSTTWSVNTTAEFVTSLTFIPTGGTVSRSGTVGNITLAGNGIGILRIAYSENTTGQTREGTLSVRGSTDKIIIRQASLPDHIHVGDVVLTTQEQVDTIRNTLGSAVTVIDGYLQIGPSTDITDLSPLNFLTEITENFFIGGSGANNSALTNIGDFPNLQKIGGGYSVAANTELIHGGNFPVLESIGDEFIASGGTSNSNQNLVDTLYGYFFIRSNSKLESLGTFPRLKRIGTSFTARGHDSLRSLYEFPSLISIGEGSPYVSTSIGGSSASEPNTSIVIGDSPMLASCCVLRNFFPGEHHEAPGKIFINNNAMGCDSIMDIKDAMCPPTIILESTNTVNIANTATTSTDSIAITFVVGSSATGWKVTLEEDTFITLGDTTSSVGRVTLKVAVTANTERMSRMGTITLTAIDSTETANTTVTITQSGILSTLMLTSESTVDDVPNTATAPSDSIAITFVVGGGATGWKATTLEENSFITLSDITGLEGSNTIKVAVTENMGVSRMNTIEIATVGGEGDPLKTTVAITQRGASPTLMLISADSETIAHDADDASDITFTIGGGGAERWTAAVIDGGNFLTLDPPAGDADATTIRVVTVEKNRGEERTNTIVITTVGGTGDTIIITQEEAPTIEITDPSDGIIAINHDETALQTIIFDVRGGSSATGWRATSSGANAVSFNSPTTSSSLGRGELTVTPSENTGAERTTTITISTTGQLGGAVTEEVTIIQQGPPPTLSLTSDRENTIAYDGTTVFDIEFTVGGGATGWKADVRNGNREEFITLDRLLGDRGSNTLRVTSDENTGEERMNSIVITTVGGIGEKQVNITVTQEAVPTIKLTTNEIVNNIIYIANHEVTPQTIRFNIGGSATGWTARSDQSFVALDKESGDSGTGIELIARPVSRNDGVEREATITISTAGHLGQPLTAEVTIVHRGAPPTLMLTSKNRDTITHDAVSVSDITFTVGGGATGWQAKVIGEDKFLTLVDSVGNAGTDTIRVTSDKNIGKARMNTIVITTVGGRRSAVTKTITIMQEAGPPTLSLISDNSVDVANTATSSDSIEIRFIVGGEATGWTAAVDADFVTLGKTMGSAGSATLKAAVTESIGERTATITISTTGHSGNPITEEVTIVQGRKVITYTGDITVTTQEQVNALGVSGGALAGDITKIIGNVVIKGSVTDLSVFNTIDAITGYLRAEGLTGLRALSQETSPGSGNYVGLTNLKMVGGYFIVGQGEFQPGDFVGSANTSLDSVGYFPHLDSIGGFFEIRDNESLNAVGSFPVLRSIGGRFRLRENPQLLHIPDFDGLVQIGQEITIEENERLITVGSFPRLETIGGDFNFTNNRQLTMRGTYPVLRSIGNNFKVDNCDKLQKINNFPSLTTIKNNLQIRNNAVLKSTGNFPVLNSIEGKLEIRDNNLLGDCCGLSGLLSGSIITGSTTIRDNAAGCDSESQINTPLTLISSNVTITYDNTDPITIDFILGCGVTGWTSAITYTPANANFITLSSIGSTTQTGAITVMATPTENTGVERTATITFTTTGSTGTADITITQEVGTPPVPDAPTLILTSPSTVVLAHDATTAEDITFIVGDATGWTSEITGANFITLNTAMNDAQTGGVTVMATPSGANTGVARIAVITFTTEGGTGDAATAMVTIRQEAAPPTLMLTSRNKVDVLNTETTPSDSIEIMFTVGGGATGWTAAVDADFVTLGKTMGSSGTATLKAAVEENTSAARSAVITFTTEGGTGAPASATVTIRQSALPDYIHVGDVVLTTQAQVDTIRNTLGSAVTVIDGYLIIGPSTDINNLDSLRFLTEITENFEIDQNGMTNGVPNGNSALVDIGDFPFLQKIGGDYYVTQNTNLVNGGNFPVLEKIGGIFFIRGNDRLESMGTFPRLKSIGTYFSIRSNEILPSLYDFPALTSIGMGSAWVPSVSSTTNGAVDSVSIVVENNDSLQYCCVLRKFNSTGNYPVSGGVYVNNNATEGCDEICTFLQYTGNIVLRTQQAVDTIRATLGDPRITILKGGLTIGPSDDITDLSPLNFLTEITGGFRLGTNDGGNSVLVDVGDFPALQRIGDFFLVQGHANLEDLGNFPVLGSIGGNFDLRDNANLEDLGNFPVLGSIGGNFFISNNNNLEDVGDFPALTRINRSFHIIANNHLEDVGDFPVLERIRGLFEIRSNANLEDMGYFPSLTTIGGHVNIRLNDHLIYLYDFPALTSIGSGFGIISATKTSVELIDNLSIVLQYNSSLKYCCVLENFRSGGSHEVSGEIRIERNAAGCNSASEATCGPSVEFSSDTLSVPFYSTDTAFSIVANTRWRLHNPGVDWIETFSVSEESPQDSVTAGRFLAGTETPIRVNYQSNTTSAAREVGLVVSSLDSMDVATPADTLVFIQEGSREFFELQSPTVLKASHLAGNVKIHFRSNVGWRLSRASNNWIRLALDDGSSTNTALQGNDTGHPLTRVHVITVSYGVLPTAESRSVALTLEATAGDNSTLASHTITLTQAIPPYRGDIVLENQAQVDTIRATLGDPRITVIAGNFTIGPSSNITDLSPLNFLTEITGDFNIGNFMGGNAGLVNTGDFSVLERVGGDFTIQNNANLENVGDFPVLERIGGEFFIQNNANLENVGDFSVLERIGEGFFITNNANLEDAGDFPALERIGGSFFIRENANLKDLGDFPALERIGGGFFIQENANLKDLGDFPALERIDWNFFIQENANLEGVGSFPSLTTIGQYFSIRSNDNLVYLYDFPLLTSIGSAGGDFQRTSTVAENDDNLSITIQDNPLLKYCCVLTNFRSGGTYQVSGSVYINRNASGCSSDSEATCNSFIDVLQVDDTLQVPFHTTDTTFTIVSNARWQLSKPNTGADWVTMLSAGEESSPNTIMGGQNGELTYNSVTVNYHPNSTDESRAVNLLVSFLDDINVATLDDTLTLMQEAKNNILQLQSPNKVEVSHSSGSTDIHFRSNVGWRLSKPEGASWITNFSDGTTSNADTLEVNIRDEKILATTTTVTISYEETPTSASRSAELVLVAIDENGHVIETLPPVTITITQTGFPSYTGDITLTTQQAVDTIRNALGNPRITAIKGNLIIGHSNNITDLSPLDFLTEITGNFEIGQNGMTNGVPNGNSALVDIGDFPFLQKIGGGYYVTQNTNLVNGGNFPVLEKIGGVFFIRNSDRLESMGTFPRLKSIGTYFSIRSNEILPSLYDFPALTSIGMGSAWVPSSNSGNGSIVDSVSIVVENNSLLAYCCVLTKFGSTISIAASIYINDNLEGCNSASQASCNSFVTFLQTDTLQVSFHTTDTTFTIVSNARWRLNKPNTGADWVTMLSAGEESSPNTIMGGQNGELTYNSVTVSYHPNSTDESRAVNLLVSFLDDINVATLDDTLTLMQEAKNNILQLQSPNKVEVSHSSDSTDIHFRSNVRWRLRKPQDATWMTLSAENTITSGGNLMGDDNEVLASRVNVVTLSYEELPADTLHRNIVLVLEALDENGNVLDTPPANTLMFTQSIPPYTGSITLFNQEQVNNIHTTLGDPRITAIKGNLTIGSSIDITDLSPLNFLTEITGSFRIGVSSGNTALADVGSFPVLRRIGGNFEIRSNDILEDAGDFPVLERIGGNFEIRFNNTLENVVGFPELNSIKGNFFVSNNNNLKDMGDFSELDSIGGYFLMRFNPQLERVGSFSSLVDIGGYFSVNNNNSLRYLYDFPALMTINRENSAAEKVVIMNNPLLEYCCVLTKFRSGGIYPVSADSVNISGNATMSCNSVNRASCDPFVDLSKGNTLMLPDTPSNFDFTVSSNGRWKLIQSGETVDWVTLSIGDNTIANDFIGGINTTITRTSVRVDHSQNELYNARTVNLLIIFLDKMGNEINSSNPDTLTIIQEENQIPKITLTSHTDGDSIAIAYDEVVAQTIMFSIGGGATGWTSDITGDDFITLDTDMNVAQDTGVAITVRATPTDENTGTDDRIATITITTMGGTGAPASARVTIRQEAAPDYIYTGDITVTTQEQVDALGALGAPFADGNTIHIIQGDVVIKGSVTDLSIFNNIDTITGYLRAEGLTQLRALSQLSGSGDYVGLTNLKMVGGYFIVGRGQVSTVIGSSNTSLDSVGYFPRLESIGSSFEIRDNTSLDAVGSFPVLRSIGGRFRLRDNNQLLHIPDFDSLVQIGQEITMEENDRLITVGSFPRLETIGGDFNFTNNANLTMRGTYPVLRSIGNEFRVNNCDRLKRINDFPSLTTIGSTFFVSRNDSLRGIGDFPVLTTIRGSLRIQSNPLLGYCCGFSKILLDESIVSGSTTIQNNAAGCDSESQINTPLTLISSNEIIAYDNTDSIAIDFTLGCGVTGWTSIITYTPTNSNFITLSSTGSTTQTGAITIMATPTENTGVERTVTITLTTTGSTGTADTTITITQAAGPPTLTLSRTTANVDDMAQTLTVGVTLGGSAESWDVTETDDENFITISKVGDDSLRITILENSSTTDPREATLTFTTTGGTGEATQTLMITQLPRGLEPPTLTLSLTTADVDATAQMLTVGVTLGGSAEGWDVTVTDNEDFIDTLKVGDDSLRITISKNSSTASRKATLTFTTEGADPQTLVITQAGGVPTLSITGGDSRGLMSEGGSENIEVMSNTTWRVTTTASSVDSLIFTPTEGSVVASAVPSGGSITLEGTGSGTLRIVYAANTEVARMAMIILTTTGGTETLNITLTQAAAPPTLEITTPSNAAGDTTVAYTATTDSDSVEIVFTVGNAMGWESMISYGDGVDEFITLSDTVNVDQTGEVRIKAAVTENEGVERSAVITLMTRGGTGAPATATVMITQSGALPTLRLISKNRETLAYDETTETAIMFEVGGGATGWRSSIAYTPSVESGFITLNHSSSGSFGATATGTVAIRVTPMENTGVERTAVITLTTMGGTGVATNIIIITQESAPTIALSTSRDIHIAYNEVSAQLLIFDIGGSATGWIVSSDQDFVTLNNERGSLGTGIEVLATPTINNGVSPRTATITISTTGQLGSGKTATVMLTQDGAPASPVLVPLSFTDGDNVSISYDSTTETVIEFVVGGGATGWGVSSSNEDFITIHPSMGAPGQNISVTAIPEGINTGVERTAVITLSTLGPESTSLPVTATLTIVQGGASPVLSLTSEVRDTLAYDAQTASDITFNLGGGATGWRHEITYSGTSEAFLTLTGDTTMSGEVRVGVTSEVNMGMERTATITIKTEGGSGDALDTMITIVQATSPPVLRLISSHREVIAHDRITVRNIIFDVGGGATGWEVSVVEDDNNFLTVDRTMGVPGENIAVEARSRGLNAGVERSAVVRIRAMRGVGVVVDTFVTITQMGAVPTLSVGDPGGNIAYNSTEATINFSIGGGATGWRVSSIRSQVADENFITSPEVGEIRNVRGDQRLSITLEENRGLQRLAVITLETVGGTSNAASADFLILQDAAPPTLRLTSIDSAFISHDVTRLRDITFEVGGGATGWRAAVMEGNDFLTLSNNRGSSGLDRIRVDIRNNLGLSRTGRISIRTVGGAGSALDTFITIRQGSAPPTLTLISSDREDLAYDAKKASDITFNLGGGATGWSSDITYSEGSEAFITLTGEEDKRGDVRVVVASEVNTGMERTATITIKTEGGSGDALDAMITIVQELVPTISVTTPTEDISIAYDEVIFPRRLPLK